MPGTGVTAEEYGAMMLGKTALFRSVRCKMSWEGKEMPVPVV